VIDRRAFIGAGLALLGAVSSAHAQRLPRIGFLTPGVNVRDAAFWHGMRDVGYVEGKTIVSDRRSADGDLSQLAALAADIVRARPDVIAAVATPCCVAAKQATSTIPIVMIGVSDPVAAGLVGNLARPGGNVTGTASQSHAAVGKQFELIHTLVPRIARVAVLWDPANAIFQQLMLSEALGAAARLHILARMIEVRSRDDLERTFAAFPNDRPDAVMILQDPLFVANANRIAELALANRMPVFSGSRPLAEAGILAAYGTDLSAVAKRSAVYVQKILKGAKPGDLPVELPTKFELVINEKTANALGIAIPAAVRARADEVIR
jgi:putative ABC transport system substrate-binding protein